MNYIIFLLFTLIDAQNNITTTSSIPGNRNGGIQETIYNFLQTLPSASSVTFFKHFTLLKVLNQLNFKYLQVLSAISTNLQDTSIITALQGGY